MTEHAVLYIQRKSILLTRANQPNHLPAIFDTEYNQSIYYMANEAVLWYNPTRFYEQWSVWLQTRRYSVTHNARTCRHKSW